MSQSFSGTGLSQSALAGALDALWARFLPDIELRVFQLQAAAAALEAGALRPEQQQEAHSAAHKLAGTLGTFGLTRGTELARELESSFSPDSALTAALAARLQEIAAELRTIVASRTPSG